MEGHLTMDWHPWIVYAHVLGTFAICCGARGRRHDGLPTRIAAILDYSLWQLSPLLMASTPWILVALLLMMFKP